MKNKISILGCGWLGLPLAKELVKSGCEVKGSCRSANKISNLALIGVKPHQVDISNYDAKYSEFLNSEILIIAIPSKSISDFENIISKIENSNIKKIIFVSSTSVYPFTNGVVTENMLVKETPLSKIEELFRTNKCFQTTILRFGGLFGDDRKPGNFIKPNKLIENPEGYVNLIHREDCIAIVKQIIATNTWNETLNACADTHPTRREFYNRQAQELKKSLPSFNEMSENTYKIINSEKLKELLAYTFKYADLME